MVVALAPVGCSLSPRVLLGGAAFFILLWVVLFPSFLFPPPFGSLCSFPCVLEAAFLLILGPGPRRFISRFVSFAFRFYFLVCVLFSCHVSFRFSFSVLIIFMFLSLHFPLSLCFHFIFICLSFSLHISLSLFFSFLFICHFPFFLSEIGEGARATHYPKSRALGNLLSPCQINFIVLKSELGTFVSSNFPMSVDRKVWCGAQPHPHRFFGLVPNVFQKA